MIHQHRDIVALVRSSLQSNERRKRRGIGPEEINKKSTHVIKTPKHEIDLIKDRLKRLKEILQ